MASKDILKDKAIVLAESTRDTSEHKGFLAGLFEGRARFNTVFPFPSSSRNFETIDFLSRLKTTLTSKTNPDEIDQTGEIPDEAIQAFRDLGIFGIKIPKEYGGLGFHQSQYKDVAIMLGGWDGNLTALVSAADSIGVGQPLMHFGTPEQIQRIAPRLAKGAISAFALTEPEAGSDLTRIRTYAKRVRADVADAIIGYELCGTKLYITNATKNDKEFLAELLMVIARIVDDPKELDDPKAKAIYGAFIVETSWPGMSVVQRCRFMGLRALYSGLIALDKVYCPVENLLGKEGKGIQIALNTLAVGRLTLPAACLGAMKQALSISRLWGKKRVQWGSKWTPSIGNHELISKKIVDIAAHTLALQAVVDLTCNWVDQKKDVRLESAACKILGSEWLKNATDETLQIRSGRGYETASSLAARGEDAVSVERMYRDNRINLIFEGTNQVMRLWQAREELEPYVKRGMAFQGGDIPTKLKAISGIMSRFLDMRTESLPNVHPRLRKHLKFVNKQSKKLTRIAIVASGAYQQKMAFKQLTLARLSEIAMELFAITATVAYVQRNGLILGVELADYFCWEARKRIAPLRSSWQQIFFDPNQKMVRPLVIALMDGSLAWLEYGTIPLIKE